MSDQSIKSVGNDVFLKMASNAAERQLMINRQREKELQSIVVGDVVLVRDDSGNEAEYRVKAEPWQLGHGAWVLGLAGISGGYSLDRVVRVVRKNGFPVRLYVKEYSQHGDGDWFWKSLCVVYDNESLGLLQRLLGTLENKTEPS